MPARHCHNSEIEVYEITGDTVSAMLRSAANVVKGYERQGFSAADSYDYLILYLETF